MVLKKNTKLIIPIFLIISTFNLFCQSKTSNWFSGSLNKQNNELLVVTNNSNVLQKFSLGVGIGFGFNTKLNKSTSLNYGLTISSHNNLISLNNFEISNSNTSIKIPISYRYDLHLKSKNSIVFMNGLNFLFQGDNMSNITLDNYVLSIKKNIGIFPLYQGSIGYNWIKKGEHQILLKYNYGFKEASLHSIYRNENLIYQLSSRNTYFEIEYRIVINKSP